MYFLPSDTKKNSVMPVIITALYINCPKLLFLVVPFGTPERNKICCETLKKNIDIQ